MQHSKRVTKAFQAFEEDLALLGEEKVKVSEKQFLQSLVETTDETNEEVKDLPMLMRAEILEERN